MAPRPIWQGSIAFGLVNIPVGAVSAVRSKDVHFHQIHAEDGGRIREKRVCEKDGKEVPYDEVAKGYEIAKGKVVMVGRDELAAADPEANKLIEIEQFVKLEEVDPFQMDKSYFLTPSKGAGHAYALLREGMERTKRVGIARWVMHTKQHLCIVRPVEGGLGVTTLAFADELLKMPEHESAGARPKERELKMAEELIENMAASFEPEKFKDDHRERVIAILERKAKGEDIVSTEETDTKPTKVTSLAKMLEESLSQAKAGSLRFQRQAARTGRAAKAKAPAKAASTKRARAR